ncbi:DNA translocase FtsK [Candidatus Parcubacteria bacterium]|nr:MAG: DNA translocase FtsK [Candidatus Parcubacteria bacterium]
MAKKDHKRRRRDEDDLDDDAPRIRWHDHLAPETKRSALAILCAALAILTLLAYWNLAGMLGSYIAAGISLAVGNVYFLAPLTLLVAAGSLVRSFHRPRLAGSFVGAGLFLITGLALIELFFEDRTGGWIGYAANWPLEQAFAFWGALVIEIALFAVAILIAANIPIWRIRKLDEETVVTGAPESAGAVAMAASAVTGLADKVAVKPAAPAASGSKVTVGPGDRKGDDEEFSIAKRRLRSAYRFPPLDLLDDDRGTPSSGDVRANANIIKRTLLNFGVDVEMGDISIGPTVTQYTLKPAEGVKLARIVGLQNDLALALAAHPIRIEAPIPGKSLVGIEVPNRSIALVGLRSLFEHDVFQESSAPLLFALGRDVAGAPVYANLAKMPHMMIAGATGSGKSVGIHAIVTSFLYRNPPEMLKLIMLDPKRVELSVYEGIPHLLTPPITDSKKMIQALRWAVKEMEKRYQVLSAAGVRDIASYNESIMKKTRGEDKPEPMPWLVIVIDELADLMMSFPREVEGSIVRIAQMARAVGIHLIVATQRPSVEVITGLIKANITSRVAFQVASQIDSRTILDGSGAEKLLGNGDMLFLAGDTAKPKRIQGGFVSDKEIQSVVKFIRDQVDLIPDQTAETEMFEPKPGAGTIADALGGDDTEDGDDDPLYEEARDTVVRAGKASASYLQRRLKIGYARAARLLDILEERGVIGPGDGAKPREVLVKAEGAGEPAEEPTVEA